MQTSFGELETKLGPPVTRGTRVAFGADGERSRYAFVGWACNKNVPGAESRERGSGCGAVCMAFNVIPYENDVFPDDNWVLEPCDMHANLQN